MLGKMNKRINRGRGGGGDLVMLYNANTPRKVIESEKKLGMFFSVEDELNTFKFFQVDLATKRFRNLIAMIFIFLYFVLHNIILLDNEGKKLDSII